ncbi:MAG: LacI family DNA-binding transcriptional regulator [Thermomicrobiales bacterium]
MIDDGLSGRPPTLRDVAERAGVSRQTVSRVINDKGEIADSTRERVLAVIQDLGYQPNSFARSLATNTSMVIGLVVPTINHPFFAEITRGVEDEANRLGYSVFLCTAGGSQERERRAIERLRGHRVAGLVTFNSHLDDETFSRAHQAICPVVQVNREVPGQRGLVIWPGYEEGGTLATRHLIGLGRRTIGYIGFSHDSNLDADKYEGYRRAHFEADLELDPRLVLRRAPSQQSRPLERLARAGYEALEIMLRQNHNLDAVFASNDLTAIGAIQFARAHGIKIPDDLALIGFGGSNIGALTAPTLSTIAMPLQSMGECAVRMIVDEIKRKERTTSTVDSPPELIERESTGGMSGDGRVSLGIWDDDRVEAG